MPTFERTKPPFAPLFKSKIAPAFGSLTLPIVTWAHKFALKRSANVTDNTKIFVLIVIVVYKFIIVNT
jgi:hypothetical protein